MKTELFGQTEKTDELEKIASSAFAATADSAIDEWFSFTEMKTAIASKRGICLKAVSTENKLLGFVYAQQESPINAKEGLEKWVIVITAVSPESAGQGVGTFLLKEIEKAAAERDAIKMFVYTNKADDKVVNFYEKNGYSNAGYIKDYQYGKNNSAVFLLKYLV